MISQLNKRITFESQVKIDDGGGGFNLSWEALEDNSEVYASIVSLSSNEIFTFLKREIKASHKIIIRYRDDISADMRIIYGENIYSIKSLRDAQGLGRYLEIIADEER